VGADLIGETIAKDLGIKTTLFLPNWEKFHKMAGPLRNRDMAENADALILIWDGKSRGSRSMLNEAKKAKIDIYEILI